MNCLQFGSKTQAYSPIVRLICFTIHFYSPKAYEYIRELFDRTIPSPRTLRSWYSSIDGRPGFTDCAFEAIKQKVDDTKAGGKELIGALIFDEMSIRQLSQWDRPTKGFTGHISNERMNKVNVYTPLAENVLVFMISGVNVPFKIPIGYFSIIAETAAEKAVLINDALSRLKETGLKLSSVTFDGARTNIAAVKILGAKFEEDKPFFVSQYDNDSKVYVILDPPHMLKLCRNYFGGGKQLFDPDGGVISWDLIKNLVELRLTENVNFGDKLTKTHVEFENVKQNVRLAAQTLSESTAISIEYLDTQLNHEKFRNSKPTTKFVRTINNLYDIMNSKEGHCNDKYKRPICEENVNEIGTYFENAAKYIRGCKVIENGVKKPVLQSRIYTGFFGFLHNMTSFMGIYKDYIKQNNIDELYTFSMSQDHLEGFFGCIRRMNGCNDNPSPQQFIAAYRKLLFQNDVTTSSKSNCENNATKLLSVSSNRARARRHDTVSPVELELPESNEFETRNPHNIENDAEIDNSLRNNTRAYLASVVEKNVIKAIVRKGKKKCLQCINVFSENELTHDMLITFKSRSDESVVTPCKSTVTIIHFIEDFLTMYETEKVSFDSSVRFILKNVDISQLYDSSDFGSDHDHKEDLVELVIREYLHKKSTDVARIVTRLSKESLIRHKKTKEVHRAGQ